MLCVRMVGLCEGREEGRGMGQRRVGKGRRGRKEKEGRGGMVDGMRGKAGGDVGRGV